MIVHLTWPPQATSPNGSQGKFRAKASAAKGYKADCAILCHVAKVAPMPAICRVVVTFHKSNAGHYDLDNMLARAKQGLDAFAEAIGVDDALWPEMILKRGSPVKGGRVTVEAALLTGEV